jgi:copper chaperone CopZ
MALEVWELAVDGMTCGGCVLSVEKALESVPGVQKVEVMLKEGKARATGEGVSRERLVQAVYDAGYDAR